MATKEERVAALRRLQRARQRIMSIARTERDAGRQMPNGLGDAWWRLEQAAVRYGRVAERWSMERKAGRS